MCLKFNSLASAPASVVLPLPFSPHTHIPHFIYRLRIYRQFRICFTNASDYAHTLIIAQKPQKINLRFLYFSVKNNREIFRALLYYLLESERSVGACDATSAASVIPVALFFDIVPVLDASCEVDDADRGAVVEGPGADARHRARNSYAG